MKVKEKISVFSRVVMDEVEEKRKRLIDEMEKELDKASREAEQEARRKSESQIRQEKYHMEQLINREYLNANTESRKALADLKNTLTDELFQNVEEQLRAFVLLDEYGNYLAKKISEFETGYPDAEMEVLLMNRDLKHAERINITVKGTDEDFIGGFKIIFKDRNAVHDNTFLDRMLEERANFNLLKIV